MIHRGSNSKEKKDGPKHKMEISIPSKERKEEKIKEEVKEEVKEEKKVMRDHDINHGVSVLTNNNNNSNNNGDLSSSRNYGIVLHGLLKTRYIDMNTSNKKSIFTLKSSWKLRYWRLSLTDDGLKFEKSRRANTKPYKGVLLPFGKTIVWENWGKRGDNKYCYGFTLRVACINMQMEAAADSRTVRSRWLTVLQTAFSSNVQDTKELVKYLAQKASDRLSKMTDAGDHHCRSVVNLQATKYSSASEASTSCEGMTAAPDLLANVNQAHVNTYLATDTISVRAHTYTRTDTNRSGWNASTNDDYDWKSLDEIPRDDNTIPRRYNLYDHDGYISDYMDNTPFTQVGDMENGDINTNKRKKNTKKRRETSSLVEINPNHNIKNKPRMELHAASFVSDPPKRGDTIRSDSYHSFNHDTVLPDMDDGNVPYDHHSHTSHTNLDISHGITSPAMEQLTFTTSNSSELKEKKNKNNDDPIAPKNNDDKLSTSLTEKSV